MTAPVSAATRSWRMWLLGSTAPKAVVLIRVVVGGIFLSEGIQKFLFAKRWAVRFAEETPLPAPEFFAYLDGVFEIGCGVLLLAGLLTRLATIPMIINMLGAEIFTKVPMLPDEGVWGYLHEARTELGQLFGLVFLLLVGAGAWSLDARLATKFQPRMRPDTE